MIAAAGFDWLIGDPHWSPHPVVWMGRAIHWLRQRLEPWAGDRPRALRLSGGLITAALVLTSAGAGW
ncbi:cobalamin biosynthesis protein, partial [Pseudomonas sp. HMWF031]